ncbi:heparan sulfate 2-O-sulfotransferase pipe-like [Macrobrachium nipponense]|uniref:heparan sulfate 2-O-sulfotransferase pipe-like n=1 Tax=Macrobrachium nipponense TaxID=159736 RepID=UPI0030C8522D
MYKKAFAVVTVFLIFILRRSTLSGYHHNEGRSFHPKNVVQQNATTTKRLNSPAEGTAPKFVASNALHPRVLVYNRVPKCGSSTMIGTLLELSKLNGFTHLHSSNYNNIWMNRTMLEYMTTGWLEVSKSMRFSFDRHLLFFEVQRFKEGEVAWMNLIREPVERFVSKYYYTQQYQGTTKVRSLEDCLGDADRSQCLPDNINIVLSQITYFCGREPLCMVFGDKWGLQKAKANVEAFFSVVGILEDLPTTFQVLQNVLPDFFTNYEFTFHGTGRIVENRRSEKFRQPISNATKMFLKDYLREEIEFYEYIKRRLYVQAKMITSAADDAY